MRGRRGTENINQQMLVLLAAITAAGTAPCPSYPPLPSTDDGLGADAGVKRALQDVQRLLGEQASKLPTGLVATVVYNQTTLASFGFGRRDGPNSTAAPGASDLVRIASITKVFTDVLLYKMRDAGTVGLDDALKTHMPGFATRKLGRTRSLVTLRNLGAHLSGLPREAPYPCSLDEARCDEAAVLQLLREQLPVAAPYRRFHYSNLGIALLGRALAHAAGGAAPFEALLADEVLAPLGMRNATFDTAAALAAGRVARGSSPDGGALNLSATCTPAPGAPGSWLAPCGCLWASTDDLAKLLKLFFRDGEPANTEGGGAQVLDGDTLHEMLSPAVLLRGGDEAVGSPWEMNFSSGVWVKSKQGELPGYRSAVALVEPLKLGIFVSALVSDVASDSVWTLDALALLVPAVTRALWRLAPPAAPPPEASLLVGTFGRVVVALEDAALVMRLDPSAPPLNLTRVDEAGGGGSSSSSELLAFRAMPVHSTADCRWLDDGADLEIAYFRMPPGGGPATSLRFMDGLWERS